MEESNAGEVPKSGSSKVSAPDTAEWESNTTMSLCQAEKEILELATEDYYGLWEVRWEIERLFPNARGDEILARSRSALETLLRLGWIAIFSGELKGNDMLPVDEAQLADLLTSSESWDQPSPGKEQLAIAATEAGERAYLEGST